MKALFKYFVFGNFFIAICAVVMFLYSVKVFSLKTDALFIPFIFFSTLCSYSLHWSLTSHSLSLTERLKWTDRHRKFHIVLFIVSFAATLILFYFLIEHFKVLLPLAFIAFMYTAPKIPAQPFIFLRKIAVLKTTYLTLVWVFTTCVLPVLVSSSVWNYDMTIFTLNRLFLIFPICVLFDYRDRVEDSAEGIKNIATALSERGLDIVFAICMIISIVTAILFFLENYSWLVLAANLISSAVLIFSYPESKRSRSDTLFYFYLDGLMMFSGIFLLIFS